MWSFRTEPRGIITTVTIMIYVGIIVYTSYRIIMDVRDSSKAIAYLLLIYILPIVGLILYQMLGINYRKYPLYSKKLSYKKTLPTQTQQRVIKKSDYATYPILTEYEHLIKYLSYQNNSPLLASYDTQVLINGEEKYPQLLESLHKAKETIHILYYIFEDDIIGKSIEDILVKKVQQGVTVRFIFDDFGSNGLHKTMYKRMKQAGIEIYPFYPLQLGRSLVRINNRNHRKMIIIDGKEGYVGGINISKVYDNSKNNGRYWRDTHLRIQGPVVSHLQYIFLSDRNYCSQKDLAPDLNLFPIRDIEREKTSSLVPMQIVTSGPDSYFPTILHSLIETINNAKREINITTPYLIPDIVLLTALTIAAHRGVKIRILLPLQGDSHILNIANESYFEDLLESGIEICLYKKGMIHAKTITVDEELSIIGTANLDMRSFALNFEINAMVYDSTLAKKLNEVFNSDCRDSHILQYIEWMKRPKWKVLLHHIVRLASPVL